MQSPATVSVDRNHNSRVLRTGSSGSRASARSATKGSFVQVKLERYARSVPKSSQTEALSSADRCVGVRDAVPPHHARGAEEEEAALNQLSS